MSSIIYWQPLLLRRSKMIIVLKTLNIFYGTT